MTGLRERKKAKTKLAIQQHAVRLFRAQGFAATTVEQIAEAAEVSPSTVFRYFPTKDEILTTDEFDPQIFAAFGEQPAELSLAQAWRGAMHEVFDRLSGADMAAELDRMRLIMSVPDLLAASLGNMTRMFDTMAELSARRLGREPGDREVRTAVSAMYGVLLLAVLEWANDQDADIVRFVDDAFDGLAAGVTLL